MKTNSLEQQADEEDDDGEGSHTTSESSDPTEEAPSEEENESEQDLDAEMEVRCHFGFYRYISLTHLCRTILLRMLQQHHQLPLLQLPNLFVPFECNKCA